MQAHRFEILCSLLLVYVVASAEWWSAPPSAEETDDVCTEVGSSVETEAPQDWQLQEVYYQTNVWHMYEEGLWLKATHLPLLSACYIESDTEYRPFGSVADFRRIAESMGSPLVVVFESCVHVVRKGEEPEQMALKPGLRHLRCFPCHLGIMVIDRRFAFLEATWRRDDKRAGRPKIETELIMSILRNRERYHISFW